MKKIFTILAVAALSLLTTQKAAAIEDPDPAGTINAGLNFSLSGLGANAFGEYIIKDNLWIGHLAAGANLGYMRIKDWYPVTDIDEYFNVTYTTVKYPVHQFFLIPRVTYGINLTKKLEVHAGIQIGGGVEKIGEAAPEDAHPGHVRGFFCFGFINGVRYRFSDRFAAQFELNPGLGPIFNFGAVYTF